jgi:hypothetical protein
MVFKIFLSALLVNTRVPYCDIHRTHIELRIRTSDSGDRRFVENAGPVSEERINGDTAMVAGLTAPFVRVQYVDPATPVERERLWMWSYPLQVAR